MDTELADLPAEARWREWMGRVEAIVFASARPVPRAVLAALVGRDCDLDRLIGDIRDELRARPYDLVAVAGGWHHRTRPRFAQAIAKAGAGAPALALTPSDAALLAAIAWHQPLTRGELAERLGREIPPDALARLRHRDLIGPGPRSPRPGSPHTWVTTREFLVQFGLNSLQDLPDLDGAEAVGFADITPTTGSPASCAPGRPPRRPAPHRTGR